MQSSWIFKKLSFISFTMDILCVLIPGGKGEGVGKGAEFRSYRSWAYPCRPNDEILAWCWGFLVGLRGLFLRCSQDGPHRPCWKAPLGRRRIYRRTFHLKNWIRHLEADVVIKKAWFILFTIKEILNTTGFWNNPNSNIISRAVFLYISPPTYLENIIYCS